MSLPEHFLLRHLERDVNRQGYSAIAPASNLKDMLTLLGHGNRRFDLVLINGSVGSEGLNLQNLYLNCPLVGQ